MFKFVTASGTEYFMTKEKFFWGGQFTKATPVETAQVVVGERGFVKLADGRTVRTNIVKDIVTCVNGNHISFFGI